ncbi:carboxypeptidase regulatory-like domain-containing protein [Nocardioides sp. zg-ZUI104]|uniref:carboxypeptidase regulatory-like domain-containing protein n=1 Tax=Nocardioides faecalis TaxID=2803858 RepID=UPI001BCDB9A9|nr:carboxypeptidase regulatory-like domain-containing protein [Nocardioides faecalis]MBS4754488.1 carboxypeptidase regulatory-like domain-containing protein [Nocardioides faecalis]
MLEPAGWVSGRVTDQDGAPVPNAAVSISEDSMSGGHYVFADADGRYDTRTSPTYGGQTVAPLIARSYEVDTKGPDTYGIDDDVYARDTRSVTVPGGQGVVADLRITQLKTVVFTVRDSAGDPVTDAPVTLKIKRTATGGFEDPQYGPIRTNDEGRFRVVEDAGLAFQLGFHPEAGADRGDVSEWWDGAEGAAKQADARALDFPASAPMRRDVTIDLGPLTGPAPTVSGTPRAGSRLTATAGTWSPARPDLSYQWLRDGEVITGATGAALDLTADHVGGRISVRVTATHDGRTVERTSPATTAVTADPADPEDPVDPVDPVVLTPAVPAIAGVTRAGSTLTARPGTWTPATARLSYQWRANGVPIPGATQATLRLTNTHAGKRITVTVTGVVTDAAGDQQAAATSRATLPVTGVLNGPKPKISGKAKVGKKLKAKTGTWGPGKVRVTYQWLRNGKVIKGATKASYKLGKKDRGKRIQVRVTVRRSGYLTATAVSARTAKVKR